MIIRKAEPADAGSIAQIEKECIARPWSIVLIEADLKDNPNASYFVAQEDGEIIGFIGTHDIVGEINITNVAVRKVYRRIGAADGLMQAMFDEVNKKIDSGKEVVGVTLEVRVSNNPAIKLYEKYGFKEEGVRKGYYSDGEDAIIMWKRFVV